MRKSYNIPALLGESDTDKEAQAIWKEEGIDIPDEVLYTPEFNDFLLDAVEQKNIADFLKSGHPSGSGLYTQEQAERDAARAKSETKELVDMLIMRFNSTNAG